MSQLSKPKEKCTGLYPNKAIGQFINISLFKNKGSVSVTHEDYFGASMPKPCVALALTMVSFLSLPADIYIACCHFQLKFGITEFDSRTWVDTIFYERD